MKRVLAVAFAAISMSAAGAASAEWAAGAGFEYFRWRESTTPAVKEHGMRWALDLTWAQSREPGLSAGYNLKLYNGNVDYDGATLFGGVPISGETHYRGLANELRMFYRMPQRGVDVLIAAGWDRWERALSAVQDEDWEVVYLRLGAEMNSGTQKGVFGALGIKYPAWTRENGNFPGLLGATNNPRLRPGKDFSFYGNIGYRANANWDVIAYYDSFRFKESGVVAVALPGGTAGFLQPKSRMDLFGMKVQYNF
jgi:hypothetical protein